MKRGTMRIPVMSCGAHDRTQRDVDESSRAVEIGRRRAREVEESQRRRTEQSVRR